MPPRNVRAISFNLAVHHPVEGVALVSEGDGPADRFHGTQGILGHDHRLPDRVHEPGVPLAVETSAAMFDISGDDAVIGLPGEAQKEIRRKAVKH